MNLKILCSLCVVLTLGMSAECSIISDTQKDVDCLHRKYTVNRNVSQSPVTTNETCIIFFEFEIPQKRNFFCASITSNAVSLSLQSIGHGIEQNIVVYGIDIELIKSFQREILAYRYEQLSVTTGPKYVYVSSSGAPNKYYKFDYPWWISSCHSDIPNGMLLGVNDSTAKAYQIYTAIFRRYIYPNIVRLQSMQINPNEKQDNPSWVAD